MARATLLTHTPAQARILQVLSTDTWLSRNDLAAALGRSRMYPNEVTALLKLAEADVVDEKQELINNVYTFFYRKCLP